MSSETTPSGAWARSGGAWLTGEPDGPPLGGGDGVAASLETALHRFSDLAVQLDPTPALPRIGAALLGWRASAWGHGRNGSVSGGGACRLLEAWDGWVAVNLPRVDDWEMLPAWLAMDIDIGDWATIAAAVAPREVDELVAGGQMLGLPMAAAVSPHEAMADEQARHREQSWPPAPFLVRSVAQSSQSAQSPQSAQSAQSPLSGPPVPGAARRSRPPRVVDLSSLWAGPLCSQLLHQAGATVTKVESATRPDGARQGPPAFFDALHDGATDLSIDLHSHEGVEALRDVLRQADVIIEASRPRALDQLGCGPGDILSGDRRQVWVSITGYGRTGPQAQWAALGDDAGVAGGLAVWTDDKPVFCADAVADPLTGAWAAVGALESWLAGGSHLVDVAMREVAASAAAATPGGIIDPPEATRDGDHWSLDGEQVLSPRIAFE